MIRDSQVPTIITYPIKRIVEIASKRKSAGRPDKKEKCVSSPLNINRGIYFGWEPLIDLINGIPTLLLLSQYFQA